MQPLLLSLWAASGSGVGCPRAGAAVFSVVIFPSPKRIRISKSLGLSIVRQDHEQALSLDEFDQQLDHLLAARLVEGRERAVDDENVGTLHEAADEIDARPLLRRQQPPAVPT